MVEDPDWSDDGDIGGDLDPISQEGVTWFAAMHADEVARADRAAFRAWMRREARHRAAYADVERLWSGAADLPVVKARHRASRLRMTRRGFGAIAVGAAVGGSAWVISSEHPFADYHTAAGIEDLVACRAAVLFYMDEGALTDVALRRLARNPLWSGLPFVRTNRLARLAAFDPLGALPSARAFALSISAFSALFSRV